MYSSWNYLLIPFALVPALLVDLFVLCSLMAATL